MRKVNSSSNSRKIPYDLVSELVILRDFVDTSHAYLNDEHETLVDIADSLYNMGWFDEIVSRIKSNYPDVFEKYGEDFFKKVIDDASAIDSQINSNNVNDLIDEYVLKANEFENGGSVESSTRTETRSKKVMASDDYYAGYRTAIVDENGWPMFWCDELQGWDQIETILMGHPEWSVIAIEQ